METSAEGVTLLVRQYRLLVSSLLAGTSSQLGICYSSCSGIPREYAGFAHRLHLRLNALHDSNNPVVKLIGSVVLS